MKRVLLALALLLLALQTCTPRSQPATRPPTPAATLRATTAAVTPQASPVPASALWFLTRGGPKADLATGVAVDSTGDVYLGAHQQAVGELFTDMAIYKFTPDGQELWQTHWGGKWQEKAFVVAIGPPLVYVGGLSHRAVGLQEADMAIVALDMQDGHLAWEFRWGQPWGYQEVDGLVVDGDDLYASGWTTGEQTSNDVAILKLDRMTGRLLWVKTWGGSGYDTADGQMVVDGDTIYVCGRIDGKNYALGGHAYVAKFSKTSGDYLTHKTWGGALMEDALGMTSDGTYLYVVGLTLSHGKGRQIFLLKYDKQPNLLWDRLWGGPKGEAARAIAVDGRGNILIAGHTDSYGNGANDVVLLKCSPDGKLNWSRTWGGPAGDTVGGLAIDGAWAYTAGETLSFGAQQNDALLIKADARTGQFPLETQ